MKETDFTRATKARDQLHADFAKRVKSLRKKFKWTQAQLSKKSSVSYKTVGNVERAQKAHLDPVTVTLLADAFKLDNIARDEFFAAAGLATEAPSTIHQNDQTIRTMVDTFYKSVRLPAFVHDAFFDLHSFNSYIAIVLGLNLEEINEVLFESAGPNILRLLFDPIFDTRSVYGKDDQWEHYVEVNVYLFRRLSYRYKSYPRYQKIVRELKRFPDFERIWEKLDVLNYIPSHGLTTILYPGTSGEMEFIVADSTFTDLMPGNIQMSLYVPATPQTAEIFHSSQSSVDYHVYHVKWLKKQIEILS